MTDNWEPTRTAGRRNASCIRSIGLALSVGALTSLGCGKSEAPASEFKDNVARTVGSPQQSQGMFGGNGAPADAGGAASADSAAADRSDAGCTVATRGCAATPTAADAGT